MKKSGIAKLGWILALVAVVLFTGAALRGDEDEHEGRFRNAGPSDFGGGPVNSQSLLIRGGPAPDGFSIDLTSHCTNFPQCNPGFNFATLSFSGITFEPGKNHTLNFTDIKVLSTDYNLGAGGCVGGSPRFQIDLVTGKNIFVYLGPPDTSGPGCFFGWQNTGNFINPSDPATRWDTSQICAGTQINTYSGAVTCVGATQVKSISIFLDGGWTTARGEDVTIADFRVNNKVMNADEVFEH